MRRECSRLEPLRAGTRVLAFARSMARRPARATLALVRRGVRHGVFAAPERAPLLSASPLPSVAGCAGRWSEDRPILLPGALFPALPRHAAAIRATLRLFERLRRGASFLDELWRRLGGRAGFSPAGATIDLSDPCEIEKVFADARRGGRVRARDLYAKLSWIARDGRDRSLRIRFSFGAEALADWQHETRRAPWSDRFAAALFPECAALAANRPLVRLVERLIGRGARFSERIVYSNAPGGGATFHHDDEERQLGVVFGQLAGETAWLALRKRELAAHVAASVAQGRSPALRARAGTPRRALRALDRQGDPALERLLNATPAFTRRLIEDAALFHLRTGDALLLPTHGPDDTCWHAVFALGKRPSLAHSYGIFALRPRPARESESRSTVRRDRE